MNEKQCIYKSIIIASQNLIASHDLINYSVTVKYQQDIEQEKMFFL